MLGVVASIGEYKQNTVYIVDNIPLENQMHRGTVSKYNEVSLWQFHKRYFLRMHNGLLYIQLVHTLT